MKTAKLSYCDTFMANGMRIPIAIVNAHMRRTIKVTKTLCFQAGGAADDIDRGRGGGKKIAWINDTTTKAMVTPTSAVLVKVKYVASQVPVLRVAVVAEASPAVSRVPVVSPDKEFAAVEKMDPQSRCDSTNSFLELPP